MSTREKAVPGRTAERGLHGLELWCVDILAAGSALRAMERSTPRLSDWERRHAPTFADAGLADEWLAAHIALRLVLERAVGQQARGVAFVRSAHGKPRIEGAPVAFSLSHIPGLALIALAAGGTVGVDLERARAVRVRAPRRARIEAAGAALDDCQALPEGGDARFLQAWVRLEAFAKAEGCGLGRLLTRLGISGAPAGTEEAFRARVAGVLAATQVAMTRDVALGDDLFAAVSVGPQPATPEIFSLPASKDGLERLLA